MEQLIFYLKFYLIPFLLILILSCTLILIFKRIHYQYFQVYRHSITKKAEKFLTEITLSHPDRHTFRTKLAEFRKQIPLHKSWCKQMLIDDMIRIKNNLKDQNAKIINLVYKQLDLNHFSAGLILDIRNYKKCEGIYHFQSMNYKPGISMFKKYLFHPDKILRSNANIAYLSLSKGDWQAVDSLPLKVSLLTTIKVMDVLHTQKIPMPEKVDVWITSGKKTVLKLAIMLMVFYNYRKKSAEIIALLKHEHIPLKKDVIIAIKDLYLEEAEDDLLLIFNTESIEIQLEILESLKVIGNEKTIEFLKKEIPIQESKDVKLKMVSSLDRLDNEALDKIGLLDIDTQKMINHIRKVPI